MSNINNILPDGLNDSTYDTLPVDFSDSENSSKRRPRYSNGFDDSRGKLLDDQENDTLKKLFIESEVVIESLRISSVDRRFAACDRSDSDFTKQRSKDGSTNRLTTEEGNDSFKNLPCDNLRDSGAKRLIDSKRRSSNTSKKGSDSTTSSMNAFDISYDARIHEGKKGIFSDLFRRATTRDLSNVSPMVARNDTVTRRNSISLSSDDDFKKTNPAIIRKNSKLNGLLKNMRWVDDNDGSRARKQVKTMEDFGVRYNMTRIIGRGTQGKIYIGESRFDSMPVIIKIVEDSSIKSWNYIGKLPVSIFLIKILNNPEEEHSNPLFVKYIDHFRIEKTWVLVTEHEGDSWSDLLTFLKKRKIPLTESQIMSIFSGIIKALSDLQTLGFTHNDIKDSNILINSETLHIKLIDLDSCRPISNETISASEFAGTMFYASPEVRTRNFFSPELQEIYSLGILLLSIIFLTRFPEEIEKYLVGHEREMLDPHTLPKIFKEHKIDLSPAMIKVIQSMISRKPGKRPEIPDLLGFIHGD